VIAPDYCAPARIPPDMNRMSIVIFLMMLLLAYLPFEIRLMRPSKSLMTSVPISPAISAPSRCCPSLQLQIPS